MEFKNQNEHKAAIANTFLDMFKRQSNCDVSLVIAGRMMKAHKRILSTFSTFFKDIFDELEANSSMATNLGANVAFLNYKYEHVEAVIKYMYTGVIRVAKDDWPSVLKCATDLGIVAIVEYGKQQESINQSAADNKRKMDDRGKENRSNTAEAKRSKNEPTKEPVIISDDKFKADKKESKSNSKQRDTTVEDILSGVSFDTTTRKNEKTSSNPTISTTVTQITKMSKPSKSEVSKELNNSKPESSKPNDSSKKDSVASSSQKPYPIAASTPKPNNTASDDSNDVRSTRTQSVDSDDSMEYSPFHKRKEFSEKLKSLDSTLASSSKKEILDSVRKEDSSKASVSNEKKTITCSKCGKTYSNGTHLKESELPTPPALCPISGCEKMMKMNRMLKDHLTKFHKVSLCEEK